MECSAEITEKKYLLVCKKIGNALMDSLLRSKAGMAAKLSSTGTLPNPPSSEAQSSPSSSTSSEIRQLPRSTSTQTSTSSETEAEKERRRAVIANMKSQLDSIRRSNQEKQRQIERMHSQLALVEQDNSNFAPILARANMDLDTIRKRCESKKALLTDRSNRLREAKHVLLLRMNRLHDIRLFDVDSPYDVPGHPRVRLLSSQGIQSVPGSKRPPSWHFLHHVFSVDGDLLHTMPYPTSTLIPFTTFLCQLAAWWSCPLPYPIEPLPVPRIHIPSLPAPSKLVSGHTAGGWHTISVVSAASASDYETKVHLCLAENGRALIRAIGTFPEDAMDMSDARWLNTLLWSLQIQYVHSFHNAVLNAAPTLASSLMASSSSASTLAHSQIDHLSTSAKGATTSSTPPQTAPSKATESTSPTSSPASASPSIQHYNEEALDTSKSQPQQPSKSQPQQPNDQTAPIPPSQDRGWLSFLR